MKRRWQHIPEDALITSRHNTLLIATIPIDQITEILLRLPAKSIAISRCVTKLWASILREPYFTDLFMKRSLAHPQLLLSCQKNGELCFFSTPQVRDPDENTSLVASNHHMKFPFDRSSKIRGPVSGFVCLTRLKISNGRKETVSVICNPSTGQAISLPKVTTKRIRVNSYLGFDPIDKQYKLLSMTKTVYGISEEHQVLTLSTQKPSWRKIKCYISYHYLGYANDGICINGALYYVALLNVPSKDHGIVCFDVRAENFRAINRAENMALWNSSTLVNYKGRLGVLLLDKVEEEITRETTCFELWVLVDAEKHEWSKNVYVLPPMWKNVVAEAKVYFVGLTGTDEIVLSPHYLSDNFCFYVYYYNIEKNTITRVEIKGMDVLKKCRVHLSLNHVENVKLLQYV